MGVLLFFIAYFLFLPLTLVNYCYVDKKKGYFRSSALNIDKFANREFRSLWNRVLIVENGYKFGNQEQTISEVLGHNYLLAALTPTGKRLVKILTVEHCLDAMQK